jgi:peptidoglycan-associated lipoprotein
MNKRKICTLLLYAGIFSLLYLNCVKRPDAEINAAKDALKAAKEAEAPKYAPEEYQSAEEMLNKAIAQVEENKYKEAKTSAISAKERADLAKELALKRKAEEPKQPPQEEVRFKEPALAEIPEEERTGEKGALGEGVKVKSLPTVYFEFDSFSLSEEARKILSSSAEWLKAHSSLKVLIEGHCDERGTEEYNLALGEKRAKSVRDYLMQLGVPSDNLSTISYGEEFPVDARHNEDAWAKNRRAEFVIIEK